MEIIDFINDLRKMGSIYYKIWLPIILQFRKEGITIIKLNTPLDVPNTTYYRVINYGVTVFENHVRSYSLVKSHSKLILTVNGERYVEITPQANQEKEEKEEVIEAIPIQAEPIANTPKAPRKKSAETSYPNEVYEEIINFLNETTGKGYKTNSVINRKFITQRLNDGFTIDDFKRVIVVKSTNWLGGNMEQFLRPETLFSNKFESYLNENVVSNSPNSNLKNTYNEISKATEFYNNQG